MKITYLKLVNFANIYAGMGKREITIDLSKSTNKIVLLVGPNGSGKTSILGEFHPFAYSGNMDVRNNTSVIMENSKGLKEIHFQNGDVEYIIKHHYARSDKSNSVKSFIMRDGKELNPNGNVRSFNEVVERELGLTLDYLKLIRLGSNVMGFMDMKATDRKVYIGSFLDDSDMWLSLYKKVNNDFRSVSGVLSSTTNKLNAMNITDVSALETKSKELKDTLNSYMEKRNKLMEKTGEINGKILALVPEGVEGLKAEIEEKENILEGKYDELKEVLSLTKQFCIITNDFHGFRNNVISIRDDLNISLGHIDGASSNALSRLNDALNTADELKSKMSQLGGDSKYNQLMNLYTDIDLSVSLLEKKYKNYKPNTTKETMFQILNTLIEVDNIVKDIYGFSKVSINNVIDIIHRGEDVRRYIKNELALIEVEEAQSKISRPLDTFVVYRPHNCPEDNCPYLKIHNILFPPKTEEKTNKTNIREILEDMDNVNFNIMRIASILKNLLQTVNIPNEYKYMLDFNKMLINIKSDKLIYDEVKITNTISELDEYNDYIEKCNTLKDLKLELKSFENSTDLKTQLTKELLETTKTISLINIEKEKFDKEREDVLQKIERNKELIKTIDTVIESHNNSKIIKTEISQLNKEIYDKNAIMKSIAKDVLEYDVIKSEILKCNESIESLTNELQDIESQRIEYLSLTNTVTTLNELYEELSFTRDSLSSTKGIPLVKLQSFFKGTQMYVNELLDIVYNGNLQITDFDITETEFNIPYKKGPVRIDDVRYASQGETSFLSIAISFALMSQAMSNYNIPLLDEPDSTLDSSNRALFLDILERQITDVEQVFMITHNDMFDNYPVDLILTSGSTTVNTKNRTILFTP